MTFQPGANVYTQGFGSRPENVEVPHLDVRAPTTTDVMYPVGKYWVDQVGLNAYVLTGQNSVGGALSSSWNLLGTNTGALNTLTGGTGGAVSPSAGNITLAGTTNQITTTGTTNTITVSVPTTFIAPGSIASTSTITAATGLTVTSGNVTLTNGNVVLTAAGNKINRTSVGTTAAAGANSIGTVTLVAGTATVATSNVTASSLIQLWRQSVGATGAAALGELVVGTITAGTSFVINAALISSATSLATTDVSVVGWNITN